jgi:hypothetical protein
VDSETETAKVLDTELRAELEREGVDAEAAKAEAEEGDGEDEEGNGKVGGGGGGKMSWGGLLAVAKIAGGAHHPGGALVANAAIEEVRRKRELRMLSRAEGATKMLKGGGASKTYPALHFNRFTYEIDLLRLTYPHTLTFSIFRTLSFP